MTQVWGTQLSPRCYRRLYQPPSSAKSRRFTDIMLQCARIAPRQLRPVAPRSVPKCHVVRSDAGTHLEYLGNIFEDCVRHGGAAVCREEPEEVWSVASEGTAATTTRWRGRQTNSAQLLSPTLESILLLASIFIICFDPSSPLRNYGCFHPCYCPTAQSDQAYPMAYDAEDCLCFL